MKVFRAGLIVIWTQLSEMGTCCLLHLLWLGKEEEGGDRRLPPWTFCVALKRHSSSLSWMQP